MIRMTYIFLLIFTGISALVYFTTFNKVESSNYLSPETTIYMPDVIGRIDHMAFDPERKRIFVAALGNNTVEVVDLENRKLIHTISGFDEPQGIEYIPETNSIFVANGGNGVCEIFDANDYHRTGSIKLSSDADNARFDSVEKKIYVGYGHGGIAIIDALNLKLIREITFSGHPESFQINRKKNQIFVNVPEGKCIDVIDLSVVDVKDKWKLKDAKSNFPMCLDEDNDRLFTGCRNPARMLVYNTNKGILVDEIEIDADVDDIFYDKTNKMIYLSCGNGKVDVIKQMSPDSYKLLERIQTSSGARTSLLINSLRILIVACPSTGNNEAKLLIYRINTN